MAENNDKFLAQALRLALSLRWFGGGFAHTDLLVGVVEGDGGPYAPELRDLGALVRPLPRVDPRLPRGNKVSFFLQPELDDYDTVLFLDCDILVLQDPSDHLSATELRAKIADGPTVPAATLERLCAHFGLPHPPSRYLTTNLVALTPWYINAGAFNLPAHLIDEVVPLWRHYMTYLADHPELFEEHFHYSQAGFALAYQTRPVPFSEWPVTMNYPLHLTHLPTTPEMHVGDPILLHYHTLIDDEGLLLPTPYPSAQAWVEAFNQKLRVRLQRGWRYPTVSAPVSAPVIEPLPTREPGTVLIAADSDSAALRQRLEQLYAQPDAAPHAVVVSEAAQSPDTAALMAGLGRTLPQVTVQPGMLAASLPAVQAQLGDASRVAFWEAGAAFAPPPWPAVPASGEALLPWLPRIPLPETTMQLPSARACGWLAPRTSLERLATTSSLAEWSLWNLADHGLHSRKLDWLSAPATEAPAGALPSRHGARPLTTRSRVLAVVPHYNCLPYLEQTLLSLTRQTRPLDGILVVDDGSGESPAEIVGRFPGVTLWRAPVNAGQYRVLQAAIDQIEYDAYLFQDADDWSAIDRLALCLAEAERTGADLVGSQEVRLLCDESAIAPMTMPLDVNLALRLQPLGLAFLLGMCLISRDLLLRLGGFATGLPLSADSDLVRRAIYAGRVVNLPDYSYYRRKRANSDTTSPESRAGSPARLATQKIVHGRALENRDRIARGAQPDLSPPKLAGHVRLIHDSGPRLQLVPGAPPLDVMPAPAPVCVTGMHRAGTSMITRLLNLCGMYLGPHEDLPEPGFDNPEGYWENHAFVCLNDALLERLPAAWDWPPTAARLAAHDLTQWDDLNARGGTARARLDRGDWWGWKDPRNSLTLPFWQALVPGLRVVVCLRAPGEVAASLLRRGTVSQTLALQLWETYYTHLLAAAPPEARVVTHYSSYFFDPAAELRRLLAALGVAVPAAVLARAVATIARPLRHHHAEAIRLPDSIATLYDQLCAEAGPVYTLSLSQPLSEPAPEAPPLAPPQGPARAETTPPELRLLHLTEAQGNRIRELEARLADTEHLLATAKHEVHALHRAKVMRLAYRYWEMRWHLQQAAGRLTARMKTFARRPPR